MGGGQRYSRRLTRLRREGDGAGIIRLSSDVTEFHAAIAAKRHIKWRRRRRTSPAQRYYITTLGRQALKQSGRRQPVPDRTLAAQGPQARRLPQPSPAQAGVNHREYRHSAVSATKAKKSPDFSGDFFIGFRLRYPQYPVCLHHQDRDKPLLLHVRHK